MLKQGQQIEIRSGMTSAFIGRLTILQISKTGKRVVVAQPRYATGRATFYRHAQHPNLYVESYGGVKLTNAYFRTEG